MRCAQEIVQEQITRVLLERLIVNRPHPWGLLITFIELIKNPRYNFWAVQVHALRARDRAPVRLRRALLHGAAQGRRGGAGPAGGARARVTGFRQGFSQYVASWRVGAHCSARLHARALGRPRAPRRRRPRWQSPCAGDRVYAGFPSMRCAPGIKRPDAFSHALVHGRALASSEEAAG